MAKQRSRRPNAKALMAGLVAGVALTAGSAIALGGSPADEQASPRWPAEGQTDTANLSSDYSSGGSPYAHLGDAQVSQDVLDTCRDETLKGVAPVGAGPADAEDALQCDALMALAAGDLEPGDYSMPQLEQAVNEVTD